MSEPAQRREHLALGWHLSHAAARWQGRAWDVADVMAVYDQTLWLEDAQTGENVVPERS